MGKSLRFGSIGIVIAVLVGACGQGEREPNAGSSATKAAVAEATDVIVQENPEDIAIDAGDEAVLVDSWLVEVEESVSLEEVQHIGARVLQGEVDVEPLFPDTPDLQGMYIVHAQQSAMRCWTIQKSPRRYPTIPTMSPTQNGPQQLLALLMTIQVSRTKTIGRS